MPIQPALVENGRIQFTKAFRSVTNAPMSHVSMQVVSVNSSIVAPYVPTWLSFVTRASVDHAVGGALYSMLYYDFDFAASAVPDMGLYQLEVKTEADGLVVSDRFTLSFGELDFDSINGCLFHQDFDGVDETATLDNINNAGRTGELVPDWYYEGRNTGQLGSLTPQKKVYFGARGRLKESGRSTLGVVFDPENAQRLYDFRTVYGFVVHHLISNDVSDAYPLMDFIGGIYSRFGCLLRPDGDIHTAHSSSERIGLNSYTKYTPRPQELLLIEMLLKPLSSGNQLAQWWTNGQLSVEVEWPHDYRFGGSVHMSTPISQPKDVTAVMEAGFFRTFSSPLQAAVRRHVASRYPIQITGT